MAEFKVTIVRTITTDVIVDAASSASARKIIENYGVDLAAVDMASQDAAIVTKIKSVSEVAHF